MVLTAGSRVGPFEIVAPLGAGGMGEVYRARDSRLNRDVAIKVLRPAVADDPDRLARFSREAHVLASLNHPNIGAIYGLEESSGIPALVMELVEGETLADRVAKGAVPIDEALHLAKQIAEALEAAHEQGITHRDLKPANIKLRPDGTVKVLDFGLAKAFDPTDGRNANVANSPTLSVHATQAGFILGTAAYMSPEQARGKPVDKRADIWSFGVVLFELLTGTRAFSGDEVTDTIVAVVTREPDWLAVPVEASAIRPLLRRCLKKDPTARMRDIGEARLEINDLLSGVRDDHGPPVPAARRRLLPITIGAVALTAVIAAVATWAVVRPQPQPPFPPIRFAIVAPTQPLGLAGTDRDIALSPDGRYVVYRAGGGQGGSALMLRALDSLDAKPLPGVGGARAPFFSPDSRWVAFFEGGELRKMSITGGPAVPICRYGGLPRGASWGDDDTIVFASYDPSAAAIGLWRVPSAGGEPTVLTRPESAQPEGPHWFPLMLPGSRSVLFTITAPGRPESSQVAVLDLTTGKRTTLIRGGSQAEYLDGYLIYASVGVLRAVRFDLPTLRVTSDPVTVVERVMTAPTGAANYAVSRLGTLLYAPGGADGPPIPTRSLVWVDRKGHETAIAAVPWHAFTSARVSPDGTRIALEIHDQQEGDDLWIYDLVRETMTPLTAGAGFNGWPIWTRDSQRIIFASTRAGVLNIYGQAVNGTGGAERLTTSAENQLPTSITPGDSRIVAHSGRLPNRDLIVIRLPNSGGRPSEAAASPLQAEPLIQTAADELNGEISPDGGYVAYQSMDSGRFEIYVRTFPNINGPRYTISTSGGTRPAWSRNNRELFYLDSANALTSVSISTSGTTFNAGRPVKVFDTAYPPPEPSRPYDVSPDGQRFLMIKENAPNAAQNQSSGGLIVFLNWLEELKTKLSGK